MTTWKRREDWPQVLSAEIAAADTRPFVWGEHDCCLFAVRVVDALLGSDISSVFAGKYTTARGALRCIIEYGGSLDGAGDRIAAEFGGEVIPPKLARRGDVVLVNGEALGMPANALAICVGKSMVAATHEGLISVPMSLALKAWRV